MKDDTESPALTFGPCPPALTDAAIDMYGRVVADLTRTVNYPKWTKEHPSENHLKAAAANGELFVCRDGGGAILGAVALNEDPEGDASAVRWGRDLRAGESLTVHLLAVDPAHKRQGAGGFLLDSAIEYARARGYRAVRLDIVPENLPAKRLYLSRGFTFVGSSGLGRGLKEIPLFELYELEL